MEETNFYDLLRFPYYNKHASELCTTLNLIYCADSKNKINVYLINNKGEGKCAFYAVANNFTLYNIKYCFHKTDDLINLVLENIKHNTICKDYVFEQQNPETELIFSNISKIFNIDIIIFSSESNKPIIYSPLNENGNDIMKDNIDKLYDVIFIFHHNNHYQTLSIKYIDSVTKNEILINRNDRINFSSYLKNLI